MLFKLVFVYCDLSRVVGIIVCENQQFRVRYNYWLWFLKLCVSCTSASRVFLWLPKRRLTEVDVVREVYNCMGAGCGTHLAPVIGKRNLFQREFNILGNVRSAIQYKVCFIEQNNSSESEGYVYFKLAKII